MGKAKTIFSGMAWTSIQNAANMLYGFLAVPFLIGHYGKEEYGLIGLAISINAYVTLIDMGMTNSNVRFFSEYLARDDMERVQRLFNLTHLFYLIIGIINTVVLLVVSLFVGNLFKVTPDQAITLRNLIWILAINATFSWISVCFDQLLRANDLIDWIKRRATFLKLMLFVVLFCAISFDWPIEWYFFGMTFMGTLILPWTIVKAKRVLPELKHAFGFDKELFHTVFPYAISVFSFSIFNFLVVSSRPIFLGNMIGPGAVAEFNVISGIASVVTVFTHSILTVLLPVLTKMKVQSDHAGIQTIVMQGTKYITIFISGMVFAISLSAPELLTLYVGEEFRALSPWLILWLLVLLLNHRNVMTALVLTERKLTSVTIMAASAMVAAFAGYFFLTPIIGVGGVVVGWAIHEIIHTLFYYSYFLPKRFNIGTRSVFFLSVLPSWLVFGLIAIGIYYAFMGIEQLWSALLIKSAVFGVLFLLLTWFAVLNKNDKVLLMSIVKNN